MTQTEVGTHGADTPKALADEPHVDVVNPATGEVVGTVETMSPEEVDRLAHRLRAAQPEWEALGPKKRAKHLLAWLNWIVDNKDHLLGLVHREAGKSWGDASIELMVCVEVINYYAKHGEKFLAEEGRRIHGPASFNKKLRILRRPYQLVGIITPWNYPLAMPMMDVPGALMSGAAVLTKPSEITPLAWAEVVRAWNDEIGAPPVLGCATGRGPAGRAVVDAVDMIQFTGSTRTGRSIGIRAAERLIPASLELGGKDPMIVLSDADLDRAVRGAVWGGLFNAGQSCVAIERIYAESAVYDEFVDRLVAEVRTLRQGHDAQGAFAAEYGAMATEAQLELVERHVADAVSKGARVLTGGRRSDEGLFYPATVLVDVDHSMACMREETFGPLLPVMKVDSEDQAVTLANDSVYGLAGSVWTSSTARGRRVGSRVEAGGMNINNAMTNVFQFPLPMGGWKQSGLGHRFGGPNGVRKFTRQQAFVSERLPFKNEMHWYPYSPSKGALVERALRLTGLHDWRRRLGLRPSDTQTSPRSSH
ncbi:aldehyde dehydrogenase family protein [Rhodococcus sp. T7]|uniref:aldehyde dehydrogenase family protein n=1 Tax=Rhodococcus sp. T7 TaxID=627444 RepID=UPI001356C8C6|nr:aldehyde dehydrogenase family protein [Rhodococcus sp. T7]KAF0957006.1 putative succinate-semialdehyde dehydrogenase [NADP(+)] 2 [Rhodococcus sp. T7]KAF0958711.1 putative succinate-semialdehyde dehydrogenase [NADP(+)] 2 [Rhodococcus sp. T7]